MVSVFPPPSPSTGAPTPTLEERSYYSISQAAALVGVSRMSIWRWIRAGRLPVARLGHRTSRIRREDLEQLLAERAGATAHLRMVEADAAGITTEEGADGQSALPSSWRGMGASEHVVQFYEAGDALIHAV